VSENTGCGRGVVALEDLSYGEEYVSIPKQLLLWEGSPHLGESSHESTSATSFNLAIVIC